MKVLFATHEGVPLYKGGPYVKIQRLKEHLEKLGVEVQLFDPWKAAEQFDWCDFVHLYGANFAVYNLARNLRYKNVPFVVNPIFYTRRSIRAVRLMSRIDQTTRGRVPGLWWEWGFTRDICNWAEAVYPNTQAEQDIIQQGMDIPAKKFTVLHNGVSGKFRNADPNLFANEYEMKDFVLCVGHIGPVRKNMLNTVKAMAELDESCVIIARLFDTGERDAVLKQIEKSPNITLIRGLENTSPLLASAYAACKTFVLASQFETPGRAAMEASLAGANIVITPHGGTKDYFEDMALYANPYSLTSIVSTIKQSLQQEKSDALKQHIAANFTWEVIAEKTLQAYKQVLVKL